MTVHTMCWWSARQLDDLAGRLQQQASDWCGRWGLAPPAAPLACAQLAHDQKAPALLAGGWHCLFSSADATLDVWLQMDVNARDKLFFEVFDEEAMPRRQTPGSNLLAGQMIDAMWEDWWQSLAQCLDPTARHVAAPGLPLSAAAPPPRFGLPWSGAIYVEITLFNIVLKLTMGPALAAAMLKPDNDAMPGKSGRPLATLGAVLRHRKIRLTVELAALRLDIGSLQSLQPGDVIRLPHALSQALQLRAADGTALCSAYLGQRNGMRVVELITDTGVN